VSGKIRVLYRRRSPHPATSTARELPGCSLRALHNGSNLVKRHGEDVMQHKRQALGRSKHIEDHKQRETNRFGQKHFLFGITLPLVVGYWLGERGFQGLLGP